MPAKLDRTEYDATERTLTLVYADGSSVKIRGVSLERASRLQSRAAAEAKRGALTEFFFHR